MKILLVSHAYIVPTNQQKIKSFAADKNLEVLAIAPKSWKATLGVESAGEDKPWLKYLPTIFTANNNRYFYNPFLLFLEIAKFRPDIIQVEEEPWSFACLQLLILGKIMGAKVVFFTWENLFRKHKWFYKLIEKISLRLSDGVIAGNTAARNILRTKGFTRPILVNPQFGVDTDFYKSRENRELKEKLGLTKFTLGFFSRFDEQKGLKTLLEAIKDLDLQVIFVGAGPLEDWLREQAQTDERLKVVGLVEHEKMPDYFNVIDLFVLPSVSTPVWEEQFGHVLIEAMSAEVLVIASNSGAIPEVVGEGGMIFSGGLVKSLRTKLRDIITNNFLRHALAKKGKDRVLEHYTHEKIRDKTLIFYKCLH